jgi:hypothetical protein
MMCQLIFCDDVLASCCDDVFPSSCYDVVFPVSYCDVNFVLMMLCSQIHAEDSQSNVDVDDALALVL